jgi:hypothetical protein
MSQYFTAIEKSNGDYIGVLYESNTNTKVYQTKEYPTQSQAVRDVNSYLVNKTAPADIPQTITNTIQRQNIPTQTSTCCGR